MTSTNSRSGTSTFPNDPHTLVYAYKASRFGAPPSNGDAAPAGGANAGPASTDSQGSWQISVPTNEDYYVAIVVNGTNYWYSSPAPGFSDADGTTFQLTGPLDANAQPVTNLPAPVDPLDAANKAYVDSGSFIPVSELGEPNGVATLGSDGILTAAQRPPASGGPVPTISSLSITTGTTLGGDTVTITGTNLQSTTAVLFGAVPGTLVSANATTVVVTTPATTAGNAVVTADTALGVATAATPFTFNAPAAATITSFSPSSGTIAGGTDVTITGTSLDNATQVLFGSTPANIVSNSTSSIVVTTPAEATGYVTVSAVTPQGTATAVTDYQFVASPPAAPTISSLSRSLASTDGLSQLTITGTNLGAATQVLLGSVAAAFPFISNTSTTVTVVCPAQAAATVDVVVTTAGGTATDAASITYQADPTVSSYTNSSQTIGSLANCVITGTHLNNLANVQVNNTACTIVSTSGSTGVTFTPPVEVPGNYTVTLTTLVGSVQVTPNITYTAAAPTISSLSVTSGTANGGTSTTITGTNLTGTTQVLFGGAAATLGAITATTVAVTTPVGTAGAVNVVLTAPGGTVTDSSAYTYTSGAGGPPAQAGGNQTVTVDGTPITFVPQWSDSFTGTSLSNKWYPFANNAPGAGAVDSHSPSAPIAIWPGGTPSGSPDSTHLVAVNNGLFIYANTIANNVNGNPILQTGGIGANAVIYQTPPAMIDWAMKIDQNVASLVTYALWWPDVGTWPKNQEFDIYENDGTATVSHQTTHGSYSGSNNNASVGSDASRLTTHDFSAWTYCRAIWTTTTVQFWVGADSSSLVLQSEVTAADLAAHSGGAIVAPAGGNIDQTQHAWDIAVLLEQVNTIPSGFTSTPSLVTSIAWVVGYN